MPGRVFLIYLVFYLQRRQFKGQLVWICLCEKVLVGDYISYVHGEYVEERGGCDSVWQCLNKTMITSAVATIPVVKAWCNSCLEC